MEQHLVRYQRDVVTIGGVVIPPGSIRIVDEHLVRYAVPVYADARGSTLVRFNDETFMATDAQLAPLADAQRRMPPLSQAEHKRAFHVHILSATAAKRGFPTQYQLTLNRDNDIAISAYRQRDGKQQQGKQFTRGRYTAVFDDVNMVVTLQRTDKRERPLRVWFFHRDRYVEFSNHYHANTLVSFTTAQLRTIDALLMLQERRRRPF